MSRVLIRSVVSLVMALSLFCSTLVCAVGEGASGGMSVPSPGRQTSDKKPISKNTYLLNILILGEDGTLNGSTRKAICALGESIGIFDVDLKSDKAEELGLSEEGTVIVPKDFTSYYAMNIRGMKKIGEDLDESMMRSCHYVVCPLEIKSSDKIEDVEARIRNLWNPIRAKNQCCGMYFVLVCDESMTKKEFGIYCRKFSGCCDVLHKESFFKKNTEWLLKKGRQPVGCMIGELKAEGKLDLKSFLKETEQWGREKITDVEASYGVRVVDLEKAFELPKVEPPKVKLCEAEKEKVQESSKSGNPKEAVKIDQGTKVNCEHNSDRMSLHVAASNGQLEVAKMLIKHGVDVNCKGKGDCTPLHIAAVKGNLEVAKFLVEYGADVNCKDSCGWTPLHVVADMGKLDFAKWLIEQGADVGCMNEDRKTPLHVAVEMGELKIAKLLVEHGADVNCKGSGGWTPLHLAVEFGQLEIAKWLVEHGADVKGIGGWYKRTPLHLAAEFGQLEVAKFLLDHGADVNCQDENGRSPLHEAAKMGKLKIIKLLIEHGADVNCKDDEYGWIPLHYSAIEGQLEVAKWLVEHRADVNCRGKAGWMPLHKAARDGKLEVVKWLVENGVNIDCRSIEGYTPLHWAAKEGRREVAEFLISKGANINAGNYLGKTPRMLAEEKGYYF